MDWAEVNIYTTHEGVEPLTGVLLDIGVTGFAVKDPQDLKDLIENKGAYWDYISAKLVHDSSEETIVTVYLPKNAQGADMLASLQETVAALKQRDELNEFGRLEISLSSVREEDWANSWKQYFKPIEIGQKLIIKPSWETLGANESRAVLEIDPASSFGTGQHNTTRLCLELLEKNISGGEKLLDLGCGSGILSIGAILLGAKSACAVDIDENSVKIAADNAEKNHISKEAYRTLCGDITNDSGLVERIGGGYDIVCANIVADVIIAMSGFFGGFLKDGGRLVISGLIDQRKEQAIEAVKANGFELLEEKSLEDWNAACFQKIDVRCKRLNTVQTVRRFAKLKN